MLLAKEGLPACGEAFQLLQECRRASRFANGREVKLDAVMRCASFTDCARAGEVGNRRGSAVGDRRGRRADDVVFFVPGVVFVVRLQSDFVADVGCLQGVAFAFCTCNRTAVAQPGVLHAVRDAVGIADVRGEGRPHFCLAVEGDAAGVVVACRDGAEDAFAAAAVVGVVRAHGDFFVAILQGVALSGRARDGLSGAVPLVGNGSGGNAVFIMNFGGEGVAIWFERDVAEVVRRAFDGRLAAEVNVVGEHARVFAVDADAAVAVVGLVVVGNGGNHFAVDFDFDGAALFADGELFAVGKRPAFATGGKEALSAGVGGVAFAQLPAVGARHEVVEVVVVGVVPDEPAGFPGVRGRALAQLFRGGNGAAEGEFVAMLRADDFGG